MTWINVLTEVPSLVVGALIMVLMFTDKLTKEHTS